MSTSTKLVYRLTGGASGDFDSMEAAVAAAGKQSSSGEYQVHTVVRVTTEKNPPPKVFPPRVPRHDTETDSET